MKVKIVRFIDFWFGIPICFFLSLINALRNKIRPFRLNIVTPKKLIFLEFSEIGSSILAYPAMMKAKQLYPNSELYFWIFDENKDGLLALDIIPEERIVTIRSETIILFITDIFKSIRIIRKDKIDTVIDLELFSRFSSILSFLSGAYMRAGFYKYRLEGLYRGNLHTHKVLYNPYSHISKNFISLVSSLKENHKEAPLVKQISQDNLHLLPKADINKDERLNILNKLFPDRKSIQGKDTKIVLVRFDFSDRVPVRMWPKIYYVRLIKRLTLYKEIIVVLVGKKREKLPEEINNSQCINLTGRTTTKELISLFSISKVIVGHDGGLIHLASLTDIFIIALYGPETPLLYEPLSKNKKIIYKKFSCSPCLSAYNHRNSICKNNKCMQAIGVNEVYNGALKVFT